MSGFVLLMTLACSDSREPVRVEEPKRAVKPEVTADTARDLIANAPELGDYQFTDAAYSLPLKRSVMRAWGGTLMP